MSLKLPVMPRPLNSIFSYIIIDSTEAKKVEFQHDTQNGSVIDRKVRWGRDCCPRAKIRLRIWIWTHAVKFVWCVFTDCHLDYLWQTVFVDPLFNWLYSFANKCGGLPCKISLVLYYSICICFCGISFSVWFSSKNQVAACNMLRN